MRRIARGPVRGISLKLQEEERERRDNYTPDVSFLKSMTDNLQIDNETQAMLEAIDFGDIAKNANVSNQPTYRDPAYRRGQGQRKPKPQQQ